MTHNELRRFLEEPGAHVILSPSLTVYDVGPEYLKLTYLRREDVIAQPILELFPGGDNTHGDELISRLRESFERVKSTLEPDKLDMARYDVQRPSHLLGEWEERWWKVTNIPVINPDGTLRFIVQRVEDMTLLVLLKKGREQDRRYVRVLFLLCVLLMGAIVAVYSTQQSKLSRFEAKSCAIQQRGLPAGHALARVMDDFYLLFAQPLTKQQKEQAKTIPPKQRKIQLGAYRSLGPNLKIYNQAEGKQPLTRSCP